MMSLLSEPAVYWWRRLAVPFVCCCCCWARASTCVDALLPRPCSRSAIFGCLNEGFAGGRVGLR